jgi:hypothetical protein
MAPSPICRALCKPSNGREPLNPPYVSGNRGRPLVPIQPGELEARWPHYVGSRHAAQAELRRQNAASRNGAAATRSDGCVARTGAIEQIRCSERATRRRHQPASARGLAADEADEPSGFPTV